MNPTLSFIIDSIVVLEIICAEFLCVYSMSIKKHKLVTCILSYLLITIVVLLAMFFIFSKTPTYGSGSGQNMIFGALFFIPAIANYGGSLKQRIIISFYSFSYGLIVFCLSVRLSYLFESAPLNLIALIIQSLIFMISLPLFIKFSKSKMTLYFHCATSKQINLYVPYTLLNFFLIILLNKSMTVESSEIYKAFVYFLFTIITCITFCIISSYSKADEENAKLNINIHKDALTHLDNRLSFKAKAEELLSKQSSFMLVFIDLDNFKMINDKYGHQCGDNYLKDFASLLNSFSSDDTFFYRLSGDEFVCLTTNLDDYEKLQKLHLNQLGTLPFLGFSFGSAHFPTEGTLLSSLVELADKRMYNQKKKKL